MLQVIFSGVRYYYFLEKFEGVGCQMRAGGQYLGQQLVRLPLYTAGVPVCIRSSFLEQFRGSVSFANNDNKYCMFRNLEKNVYF